MNADLELMPSAAVFFFGAISALQVYLFDIPVIEVRLNALRLDSC